MCNPMCKTRVAAAYKHYELMFIPTTLDNYRYIFIMHISQQGNDYKTAVHILLCDCTATLEWQDTSWVMIEVLAAQSLDTDIQRPFYSVAIVCGPCKRWCYLGQTLLFIHPTTFSLKYSSLCTPWKRLRNLKDFLSHNKSLFVHDLFSVQLMNHRSSF